MEETSNFFSETYGLSNIHNAKIAALLFDKLYIHYDSSDKEVQRTLKAYNADGLRFKFPKDIPLNIIGFQPTLHEKMGMTREEWYNFSLLNYIDGCKSKGELLIPITGHKFLSKISDEKNQAVGFNACLEKLQVIDQKKLSWEQVKEIRNDEFSKTGLRLLRSWIEDNMQDITSKQQAIDRLEMSLEDYNKVLKKHGVMTKSGVMEVVFDWKTLATLTEAMTANHIFELPHISEALVGIWLTGRVYWKIKEVSLKKYSEEKKDLERLEYMIKLESINSA